MLFFNLYYNKLRNKISKLNAYKVLRYLRKEAIEKAATLYIGFYIIIYIKTLIIYKYKAYI